MVLYLKPSTENKAKNIKVPLDFRKEDFSWNVLGLVLNFAFPQ